MPEIYGGTGNGALIFIGGASIMDNFEKSLSFILGNEGGLSDHPADKGGLTNLGITQSTLDRAQLEFTGLPSSVKDLTRAQAEEIYRVMYWEESKADMMPYPLCTLHFDAAVNHGVGGAAKLLQRTINNYAAKAGLDARVEVDGAVGSKTLSALCQCLDLKGNVSLICEIYCNQREAYYKAIVESNPSQGVFLRGWLNRLERNRALI